MNLADVERCLVKAFGEHFAAARAAMEELAGRYEPAELNRSAFRLYEKFRSEIPSGKGGAGGEENSGHRLSTAERQV